MAKSKLPQKDKGKSKKLARRYAERQKAQEQGASAAPQEVKPTPQDVKPAPEPVLASTTPQPKSPHRAKFPDNPPFWGRLMIDRHHPTVVIDEKPAWDKKKRKMVDGFVHRELTYSEDIPGLPIKNPDENDPKPAKLARPNTLPQRLIKPLDKHWEIPQELKRPPKKK